MLPQILSGKLGDKYTEWVHKPVDRPLRLFDNEVLEYFSKAPWWIIPTFWIPIILYNFNEGNNEANELNYNVSFFFLN